MNCLVLKKKVKFLFSIYIILYIYVLKNTMKKINFSKILVLAFFLPVFLFLLIVSCNKTDTENTLLNLPNEIIIPTIGIAEPFKNDVGKLIKGEAVVMFHKSGQILVAVKSQKNTFDKVFLFQTNSSFENSFKEVRHIELMYLKDLVVINNFDDRTSVIYHVEGNNYSATRNLFDVATKKSFKGKEIISFGLVNMHGKWASINSSFLNFNKLSDAFRNQNNDINGTESGGGGGAPVCLNGGVGSSSCSVTCALGNPISCQTTCSVGYYACCNCLIVENTCLCIQNPPTIH